jgi:hypothetical protein
MMHSMPMVQYRRLLSLVPIRSLREPHPDNEGALGRVVRLRGALWRYCSEAASNPAK